MSESTLAAVLPHPSKPVAASGDWAATEAAVGTRLPPDYRAYVEGYGTGVIDDFIWVFTPFTKNPNLNLVAQVPRQTALLEAIRSQFPDQVPFSVWPEPQGLFPWGVTDNGDTLFWLTKGDVERWQVLVWSARTPNFALYDMPMTEFLGAVLLRTVACPVFPSDFPSPAPNFRASE